MALLVCALAHEMTVNKPRATFLRETDEALGYARLSRSLPANTAALRAHLTVKPQGRPRPQPCLSSTRPRSLSTPSPTQGHAALPDRPSTHRGRRGAAGPPGTARTAGTGCGSPAAGPTGPASWRRPQTERGRSPPHASGHRTGGDAHRRSPARRRGTPPTAGGSRRWAAPRHPDVRRARGAPGGLR